MNRPHPLLPAALAATLLAGCAGTGQYHAAPIALASGYGRGDAAHNAPDQTLALQATYPVRDIAACASRWRRSRRPRAATTRH